MPLLSQPIQVVRRSATSIFPAKYGRTTWVFAPSTGARQRGISERAGLRGKEMSLLPASEGRGRGEWCRRAERICGSPPPPSPKEAARPQYLLDCARRLGDGAVGADQGFAAVAVPLMLVMRVAPLHGRRLRHFPSSRAEPLRARIPDRGPGALRSRSWSFRVPAARWGAMALPGRLCSVPAAAPPRRGSGPSAPPQAPSRQQLLTDLHRHHRLLPTPAQTPSSGSAPPPASLPLPSPFPHSSPPSPPLPPPSSARPPTLQPARPLPPHPAPPRPAPQPDPPRPTRQAPARGATEPVVRLFRAARGDNTVGPQPPTSTARCRGRGRDTWGVVPVAFRLAGFCGTSGALVQATNGKR